MASGFQRALQCLSMLENAFLNTLNRHFPSEFLVPAFINLPVSKPSKSKYQSLNEFLKNSILWAVPKHRRTIEKRRCRKYGWPNDFYKIIVPKTNILMCIKCRGFHEAGVLCPKCYAKVKAETEEMQKTIEKQLGYSCIESEVVVLYAGETAEKCDIYQGKRIIEMKKERPKIFSNNLLQKSTQGLSDSKEVVPSTEIKIK